MTKYIIKVTESRNGNGYIHFEWRNGCKYPECFGTNNANAQLMTERQMSYFDTILNDNGCVYEIIPIIL